MNIIELEQVINHLLDNNLKLQEEGKHKIAICIEGEAGTGKTAIVQQIAEKRGAGYKLLNLSSLEELGDLVGIPQKEYLMLKGDEEKRVSEKLIPQFINLGWELCPDCDPVMGYAIPEWVPTDDEQEFILYLDDYSRKLISKSQII